MKPKELATGLYQVSLANVNIFLLFDGDGGLVLVDAGFPSQEDDILAAAATLGSGEIRHILVTHCHGDHTGSLAHLQKRTGATVYMHSKEASMIAKGQAVTHLTPPEGLVGGLLHRRLASIVPPRVAPVKADVLLKDKAQLPLAGGIEIVHTPGHTPGHVVFAVRQAGAVILGDAAANVFGLRPMPNGDHWQAEQSLRRIARRTFDIAGFAHGDAIRGRAAETFRKRWGEL